MADVTAILDKKLIDAVVAIILRHLNPTRIWLFGSRANGEASTVSDYDFAFDDANASSESMAIIRAEVDLIPTLIKIDVANIAHAELRFVQRVKETGRVLFSASKQLRAEDGLLYFSRALRRLRLVQQEAIALRQEGFGDVVLDINVQRFEFTFEMSWKALKRYLDFVGIDSKNPRAIFKDAFAQGLIQDEPLWLDMIEMRNLSSHVYDEREVSALLGKVDAYIGAFTQLETSLQAVLASESRAK
ncbi:HI0074 family nucleotidyltransferase substrate-binding subunit [Iodobacter sp. CM08]|uniref:HI0074 family nucleotidyltransferase substrate-binding subunit n=1 Tax=Iodobacter sp. CM08 TaxID=3085902 RepID=UPI002982A6AF|nr:HI0074 family nucleotidyltransferase substrate-binding subunit [Iodobacter sp. CM08]MDW5416981.1 HI0074 family nucleotidyltransferase substrate-binding subunit [Iodobacter sp. CM08]